MSYGKLKERRRKDYGYILEYRTRWYFSSFIIGGKKEEVDKYQVR
jgi:hypothetical protein